MKRETLNRLIDTLMRRVAVVEMYGDENIPKEGGVLVATNHMSRFDIPLLCMNPTRPEISALVADKYKSNPIFHYILNVAGIVWLDRSKADFGAFRVALDALKRGICIGVAPEGTRSNLGYMNEGKPGTALLALKAGVPIVPVGISGTEKATANLSHLRKSHFVARFGPAFRLPPLDRANREAQMKIFTDEIMCRIAALLPEQYHGYYAGHPRLLELLANPPE
jgi:1-acyl-sn-glycerol-3-phosphate acyltransferase